MARWVRHYPAKFAALACSLFTLSWCSFTHRSVPRVGGPAKGSSATLATADRIAAALQAWRPKVRRNLCREGRNLPGLTGVVRYEEAAAPAVRWHPRIIFGVDFRVRYVVCRLLKSGSRASLLSRAASI